MRTYKVKGIIIKAIDLPSADQIFILYTLEQGKIEAVARGVKKMKSKLKNSLELFNLINAEIATGKNLDIIINASVVKRYYSLKQNLTSLSFAYPFLELIEKLTPFGEERSEVFFLLKNNLDIINKEAQSKYRLEALFLNFSAELFAIEGYADRTSFNNKKFDFFKIAVQKLINTHIKNGLLSRDMIDKLH